MKLESNLVLGFDFGERRIGVATGNFITRDANPLLTLEIENRERRFNQIQSLIETWSPDVIVVGTPTLEEGEHPIAKKCRRFANQLRGRFGVTVELVNEAHSSAQAQMMLSQLSKREQQKLGLDAMAAALIVHQYLQDFPSSGLISS